MKQYVPRYLGSYKTNVTQADKDNAFEIGQIIGTVADGLPPPHTSRLTDKQREQAIVVGQAERIMSGLSPVHHAAAPERTAPLIAEKPRAQTTPPPAAAPAPIPSPTPGLAPEQLATVLAIISATPPVEPTLTPEQRMHADFEAGAAVARKILGRQAKQPAKPVDARQAEYEAGAAAARKALGRAA